MLGGKLLPLNNLKISVLTIARIVPILLMELAPGSFRTFVVGTSYQLGNLVSSASSTIESTIGERFPLPPKISHGKQVKRYQYGKVCSNQPSACLALTSQVICIFLGCVYVYVILATLLGPEHRGKPLDVQHDEDMEEVPHRRLGPDTGSGSDEVVDGKGLKNEREVV